MASSSESLRLEREGQQTATATAGWTTAAAENFSEKTNIIFIFDDPEYIITISFNCMIISKRVKNVF